MNITRYKRKKSEIRRHRIVVYEATLDAVIEGKRPPEYLHERFLKLKAVK
jgi:hypothetical protein